MIFLLIIKNDEHIDTTKNASNHAIFWNYEELLMNFIWEKACLYRKTLISYAGNQQYKFFLN